MRLSCRTHTFFLTFQEKTPILKSITVSSSLLLLPFASGKEAGSCAMEICEPCQVGNKAALSRIFHVT